MFFDTLKKTIALHIQGKEAAQDLQTAFEEMEKSHRAFENKKQQILQEMKNGTQRSSGKLPV